MFLLYQTTNLINGKIYVGIHQTNNLNDGYIGSGVLLKKAIKKYGKENFQIEILAKVDTIDELNNLEREIVNKDFVKRRDTYNMELGGAGGKVWTDEMKKQMSESIKKTYKNGRLPSENTGRKWTEAEKKKKSEMMSGKNNPMYGKNVADYMTPEDNNKRLEKISKSNKGKKRTDEHKKNYSNAASKRIWLIHKSGKITHIQDTSDYRLNHPDWQRGTKWKID